MAILFEFFFHCIDMKVRKSRICFVFTHMLVTTGTMIASKISVSIFPS